MEKERERGREREREREREGRKVRLGHYAIKSVRKAREPLAVSFPCQGIQPVSSDSDTPDSSWHNAY